MADVVRNGRQGPIEVGGETYDAVMPAVVTLGEAQIEAVAAFVAQLAAQPPASPPPTVPSGSVQPDAVLGESLFSGRTRFTAGGAACAGCHAAGAFGGASLGPDLTTAFSRLGGEVGLQTWLANPPSPTMAPIFSERPLGNDEIAHLTAYLASVEVGQADFGPEVMLLGGAFGLVVLFAAMTFVFKRPRGRYVDQLRSTR